MSHTIKPLRWRLLCLKAKMLAQIVVMHSLAGLAGSSILVWSLWRSTGKILNCCISKWTNICLTLTLFWWDYKFFAQQFDTQKDNMWGTECWLGLLHNSVVLFPFFTSPLRVNYVQRNAFSTIVSIYVILQASAYAGKKRNMLEPGWRKSRQKTDNILLSTYFLTFHYQKNYNFTIKTKHSLGEAYISIVSLLLGQIV